MAKLTKEQRADLEAQLAADDAEDEDDFEMSIRDGDKEARLPYSKGRAFVQKHFGIDLDPEPEKEEGKEGKPEGGEVKRFTRGRRVG